MKRRRCVPDSVWLSTVTGAPHDLPVSSFARTYFTPENSELVHAMAGRSATMAGEASPWPIGPAPAATGSAFTRGRGSTSPAQRYRRNRRGHRGKFMGRPAGLGKAARRDSSTGRRGGGKLQNGRWNEWKPVIYLCVEGFGEAVEVQLTGRQFCGIDQIRGFRFEGGRATRFASRVYAIRTESLRSPSRFPGKRVARNSHHRIRLIPTS